MNFIYVIQLLHWNHLIDLITHTTKTTESTAKSWSGRRHAESSTDDPRRESECWLNRAIANLRLAMVTVVAMANLTNHGRPRTKARPKPTKPTTTNQSPTHVEPILDLFWAFDSPVALEPHDRPDHMWKTQKTKWNLDYLGLCYRARGNPSFILFLGFPHEQLYQNCWQLYQNC